MRSSASATLLSASRSGKSLRACSTTGALKSGMPVSSGIHHFYAMDDAFAFQNVFRFAEIIAYVALGFDPLDVTADAIGELDLRFVANRIHLGGVARQVTHFAPAEFTARDRCDVDLECSRNYLRDFADRSAAAAADIHGLAVEFVAIGRKQVGARDVFHKREIARLFA